MHTSTPLTSGMDVTAIMNLLYDGIDGYGLAAAGRERSGTYHEDFTYGDITPECTHQMLTACNAKPGERFYDLGSGTGKAVILASLLFDLAACKGVELVEELHNGSKLALDRYRKHVMPLLPSHKTTMDVDFVHGNTKEHDWSDADIVYTHCTCYGPDLMEAITRKAEMLKPGARIVTVSKGLHESPHITLAGSAPCQMAWGSATLYFYHRI